MQYKSLQRCSTLEMPRLLFSEKRQLCNPGAEEVDQFHNGFQFVSTLNLRTAELENNSFYAFQEEHLSVILRNVTMFL